MQSTDEAEKAHFRPRGGVTAAPSTHPSGLILPALIVAIFVAARLWRLTAACLWFDEIFGVHAARYGWARMLRLVAADLIHPPLFYALLKVWIGLGGESPPWLRLLPATTAVAAVLPFLLLCRELGLRPGERNLALLLAAVNGYLIKYAQELRMYSLLLSLTLCSLWLFLRWLNAGQRPAGKLPALCAANLLLVYTHYYGWLVVALQALSLLLWRRDRLPPFLMTVAALLLCYLPWVYAVIGAAELGGGLGQNIGWVARPGLRDVVQYLTLLHTPFSFRQSSADALFDLRAAALTLLLFGIPLSALLWRTVRHRRGDGGRGAGALRWLLLFSFAPVLLALLLSWVLPYSIWGTRHLIIAAGPYSILAAVALRRLRPRWARVTVCLLLCCWYLPAGAMALLRPAPDFIWCAWGPLARRMAQAEPAATGPVPVYAFEDLVAYHLWFSLAGAEGARFRLTVIKGVPGLREDPAYFLPRGFDEVAVRDVAGLEGEHVWVAFRAVNWDEARPPLDLLGGLGYRPGEVLRVESRGQQAFLAEFWRGRGTANPH